MKVIDLSHPMTARMPVFPGSESPAFTRISDAGSQGYNELLIHMPTHTGTHIDCGFHLFNEGFSTGNTRAEKFVGKGMVLHCLKHGIQGSISKSILQEYEDRFRQCDYLLIFSGWDSFWGEQGYFEHFPLLDEDAANYLTQFSLKGVGIDAISFDPVSSLQLPVHRILLSHEILLVENLTHLQSLPDQFLFICLPLKIENGDGSPVRAVAITGTI